MTTPFDGHRRLYRSLLRVYPAEYRARFADQMVQLFGDQLRDLGTARTWLRALGDVAATAPAEHLRRSRNMAYTLSVAPSPASRLLGLLGIVGGAGLILAFFIQLSPDVNLVRLLLFLTGALAVIVAVHLRQRSVAATLALAGALPALIGNGWLLLLEVLLIGGQPALFGGTFGWILFWASLAAWLGSAWFGLITFRLGVVTRFGALALVVGSLLAVLGIDRLGLASATAPTIFNALAQVGIAIHGLAWILLGVDVALRRRAPAAPA